MSKGDYDSYIVECSNPMVIVLAIITSIFFKLVTIGVPAMFKDFKYKNV